MAALWSHDDVGDVLSALLGSAAMGALLAVVLFDHFSEQGAIFGLVSVGSAASLASLSVQTVLMGLAMYLTAMLAAWVRSLELRLPFVDMVGGDSPVSFEVVILFSRLVRIDGAAALVVKATTGNLVGAGFLDFMCSMGVERVHLRPSHNRR